jgi:hypothetical protein
MLGTAHAIVLLFVLLWCQLQCPLFTSNSKKCLETLYPMTQRWHQYSVWLHWKDYSNSATDAYWKYSLWLLFNEKTTPTVLLMHTEKATRSICYLLKSLVLYDTCPLRKKWLHRFSEQTRLQICLTPHPSQPLPSPPSAPLVDYHEKERLQEGEGEVVIGGAKEGLVRFLLSLGPVRLAQMSTRNQFTGSVWQARGEFT